MYPLLGVFIVAVGAVLFASAKKIGKNSGALAAGLTLLGTVLAAAGAVMLYLILSGRLILPLSGV